MFHLFNLYQLAKTERRPFYSNRNELQIALSQWNPSEGMHGYIVNSVNSKSKISVFLLAFCLYHLNSHISIKTITVYFSRIVNIDIYT